MTNAELIDLLREAREMLGNYLDNPIRPRPRFPLFDRIDAALAEHEAEERVDSATPVVEWAKNPQTLEWYAKMSPFFVEVHYNNGWKWAVVSSGEAPSEAEAKAAAIAAAKGMK